jgi:hypothetical protein
VKHERRLIVGTMINSWIFEHLWSLQLTEPAGRYIREWNETRPDWVDRLVQSRIQGRKWLISNDIVLGRLRSREASWVKRAAYLPVALVATALTLVPAMAANKKLKEVGVAATW